MTSAPTTHYAGELVIPTRGDGQLRIYPGWAACCSGSRARNIRLAGNHTLSRESVTCKRCLARIAKSVPR